MKLKERLLMCIKWIIIIICWFLVGVIGAKINNPSEGFKIIYGFMYIFYPIIGPFAFILMNAGSQQLLVTIPVFGVLGIIYISIPKGINFLFNKIKQKMSQ